MKKILLILLLSLCFSFRSYASVDLNTGLDYTNYTINDKGLYTKGDSASKLDKRGDVFTYYYTFSNDSGIYITEDVGDSDNDGYIYFIHSVDGNSINADYYYHKQNAGTTSGVMQSTYSSGGAICNTNEYDFCTNIPIFACDDESAIKAYVDNGDISGASNYDNIKPDDEYSEDVPLPHNMKILQGTDQTITGTDNNALQGRYNHDIVLSWEQNDVIDGLQFEIRGMFYYKRLADDNYLEMKEMSTPYITLVDDSSYDGATSMTVKLDTALLNDATERGYQTKCILAVRNMVDGTTSNWVSITINLEDKTASASEQSYEDGTVDTDGEYDGNSVDGGTSSGGNGNVSLTGITQYIRDGFGLLGNNGLISLMSQTFLFLPNSVWTILKFYLSAVVAVALAVFVVKVVF